jgi:hypothetical protein
MVTKTHIERIKTIDSPRKAFAALRALGYRKTDMQLTRMATTYGKGGSYDSRLSVSIPKHGNAFIIHDRGGDPGWSMISALLSIGNTSERANAALLERVDRMVELGVLEAGQEITMLQLAVALVTACEREEEQAAN